MVAFRKPSWDGLACRSRTAVKGMASSVNWAPKEEMVSEVQSRRKLGCRQRVSREACRTCSLVKG